MSDDSRIIGVQERSVYGRTLIYPFNSTAKAAVRLTGRATFKTSDLSLLQALGFKIEWVPSYVPVSDSESA